jgi:hypothetical protein
MAVDPSLLAQWQRIGMEAFEDGIPRNSNPGERRNRPRVGGPTDGVADADWIARRDAWWKGWDDACVRLAQRKP